MFFFLEREGEKAVEDERGGDRERVDEIYYIHIYCRPSGISLVKIY